jgi:hypothetical protein
VSRLTLTMSNYSNTDRRVKFLIYDAFTIFDGSPQCSNKFAVLCFISGNHTHFFGSFRQVFLKRPDIAKVKTVEISVNYLLP